MQISALRILVASCCLIATTSLLAAADAKPGIVVVHGTKISELEQLAVKECAAQVAKLFGAEVKVTSSLDDTKGATILVGNPETNPAIKTVLGDKWPNLSEQGHAIRSFSHNGATGIAGGGGSPQATLWAVYELGHHFGVRYLLAGDIYPELPVPLKFDGIEITLEPELRTRAWEISFTSFLGQSSWPRSDLAKLIGQLAKLKFNRITVEVGAAQPFVHFEYGGRKKDTAALWYGTDWRITGNTTYRIDGDTPGRAAFREGTEQFENPEFAGADSYEAQIAAGTKLLAGIIDDAHAAGLTVALQFCPLEFPREFGGVFPHAKDADPDPLPTVVPGGDQIPTDEKLRGLAAAQIRAYLQTYPTLDALYFSLPKSVEEKHEIEQAYQFFDAKGVWKKTSWDTVLEPARRKEEKKSPYRPFQEFMKCQLNSLACLNNLCADESLLVRPDGRRVELAVTDIDPAFEPILEAVLPAGAQSIIRVENLTSENSKHAQVKFRLIGNDYGVLPRLMMQRTADELQTLRDKQCPGFSTGCSHFAELEPTVYFLSRAAFDKSVTPRAAHDALFTAITGNQDAANRMWMAFEHIEAATQLYDKHTSILGFPFPVVFLLFSDSKEVNLYGDWWAELVNHYALASGELYRSHDACSPRGRPWLFYYAKRSEYVLDLLKATEIKLKLSKADDIGAEEKTAQLETAVEAVYNALDTLGDVARDQSDRALIAYLATIAYRPLVEDLEAASEAE